MMQQKTTDWLCGYIFRSSEKELFEAIRRKEVITSASVRIPSLWIVGKRLQFDHGLVFEKFTDISKEVCRQLKNDLHDMYEKYDFEISVSKIDQYYVRFYIVGRRIVKEMTLSEIENILGYSIKIVPETIKIGDYPYED